MVTLILYNNNLSSNSSYSLAWSSNLPFRFQWNIRDIIGNKLRKSYMTIFGVFGLHHYYLVLVAYMIQ